MKIKRSIALFLAVLMMFSMLPTSVFAEENGTSSEPELQVSTQEVHGNTFRQVTILDENDVKKEDLLVQAGKSIELPSDVTAEDADLVGWDANGVDVGAPGKKFTPQDDVVLSPRFAPHKVKDISNETDIGRVSLVADDGFLHTGFGRGYLPKGAATGSFVDASSYKELASEAVPASEGMATRAVAAFTLGVSNPHAKFDGKEITVRIDLKEGIDLKENETLALVKVGSPAKDLKYTFTPASGSPLTGLSFKDNDLGTYVIVGTFEAEAAQPEKAPEQEFNGIQADNGMGVNIYAPEGALPEGSTVVVKAADAEASQILGIPAEDVRAVDISFLKADGKSTDPSVPVSVTLSVEGLDTTGELKLYHISGSGAQEIEYERMRGGSTIRFETRDFSIYAVARYSKVNSELTEFTINYVVATAGSSGSTAIGGSVSPTSETVDLTANPIKTNGSTASAADGYSFVNWTDEYGNVVSDEPSFIPAVTYNGSDETSDAVKLMTIHSSK